VADLQNLRDAIANRSAKAAESLTREALGVSDPLAGGGQEQSGGKDRVPGYKRLSLV